MSSVYIYVCKYVCMYMYVCLSALSVRYFKFILLFQPPSVTLGLFTFSLATASPRHDQPVQEYHLKWVDWNNRKTPIVTQNENGPCPLIAILNVLLLRAVIEIPEGVEIVTATQLINYLGNTILQRIPEVSLCSVNVQVLSLIYTCKERSLVLQYSITALRIPEESDTHCK